MFEPIKTVLRQKADVVSMGKMNVFEEAKYWLKALLLLDHILPCPFFVLQQFKL